MQFLSLLRSVLWLFQEGEMWGLNNFSVCRSVSELIIGLRKLRHALMRLESGVFSRLTRWES